MKETKIFLTDEEDIILTKIAKEEGKSKTKYCEIEIRKILRRVGKKY